MRLLSWNLNYRVKQIQEQIAALAACAADVLALQEVSAKTAAIFHRELPQIGYPYVVDSFQQARDLTLLTGPRRYGELVASKWPLHPLPLFAHPWPERVLVVALETLTKTIHLYTTHIPPGASNGWIKIEILESLYEHLSVKSDIPRILCGDFNTPKEETVSGEVMTWGRADPRWDAGERNILLGLADAGWQDVYRFVHGYEVQEFSWYARNEKGRRFDHIIASRTLLPGVQCCYIHSLRERRLSDHSAIMADFVLDV